MMKKSIILILMAAFITTCGLKCHGETEITETKTDNTVYGKKRFLARPEGSRSIWVWGNALKIIKDKGKRKKFFDFLNNPHGINKPVNNVYLDCHANHLRSSELRPKLMEFIKQAHEHGICIQFLAGNAAWAYQNREVFQLIETLSLYNMNVPKESRFDGLHFDIEPHTLPAWNTHPKLRDRFLESIEMYGEKMSYYNPDIIFGYDVPTFWKEEEIEIFLKNCDYLALMNYVDNAASMVNRAQKFLKVAERLGKKIETGIETQGPSKRWGVTPPITFYDEGWERMEKILDKANKKFSKSPAFIGFAIHYYESYRKMSKGETIIKDTKTYPNQPVINIPLKTNDITIDGSLADWQTSSILDIKNKRNVVYQINPKRWKGAVDLSTEVQFLWDNDGIYLAFDITDDDIFQTYTGHQMVTGDHIEVWFDIDYEKDEGKAYLNEDDFQLGFSPGNFKDVKPSVCMYLPGDEETNDINLIDFKAVKKDGGYIIEAFIPNEFFGDFQPEANKKIRFNIDPSDTDKSSDTQEILMSSSICRQYGNPRSFRLAIFSLPVEEPSDEVEE